MHIHDFQQRLTDLGAKPMHIGRITRAWLRGMPLDTGTRNQKTENFLPLAVRNALPEISSELDGLARLSSEHPATDGSARLLVELADKQMVQERIADSYTQITQFRLHVLYAEHNPVDVDLTRRHLERHAPHITLEAVDSAAQALARWPRPRTRF